MKFAIKFNSLNFTKNIFENLIIDHTDQFVHIYSNKNPYFLEITLKYQRKSMIIKNRSLWLLTLLQEEFSWISSFLEFLKRDWFLWHKGFGNKILFLFYFIFVLSTFYYCTQIWRKRVFESRWNILPFEKENFFYLIQEKCFSPILLKDIPFYLNFSEKEIY